MQIVGDGLHGRRLRGLVAVLWRAGLRIDEALALHEADLDRRRGSLLVRHGKGGRRREVGMDDWGWQELDPRLTARVTLPVGPLFCIINGRTADARGRQAGHALSSAAPRRAAPRCDERSREPVLRVYEAASTCAVRGPSESIAINSAGGTRVSGTGAGMAGVQGPACAGAGRSESG